MISESLKLSFNLLTDFLLVIRVGLGTHLFVKVPRPGDSEVKPRVA